jgi:GWxTD domain-containing protein
MVRVYTQSLVALLGFGVVFATHGCSGGSGAGSDEGGTWRVSQHSALGFEMEAIPSQEGDGFAIDLYVSLSPSSVTFLRVPGGFQARYDLTARLHYRSTEKLSAEYASTETTAVAEYERTQSNERFVVKKRLPVVPGEYRLEVTLEDRNSTRSGTLAQSVTVIDTAERSPALGRLYLATQGADGVIHPVVSLHVPTGLDSLKCAFDIYNILPGDTLDAELHVLKFLSDTTVPVPPYFYPIFQRSEPSGIILLRGADTVFRQQLGLYIEKRRETFAVKLPSLNPGLYRVDVSVPPPIPGVTDTTASMVSRRFYLITPRGFPRPTTYKELIDAASFIATRAEVEEMRGATTDQERQKRFDAFWLKLVPDKAKAATVIGQYYTRIEQANRLFTTVEDGWRTDRGMVYCILGPPVETTTSLDTQSWYYSRSAGTSESVFTFKRLVRMTEGLSVEDYLLYRQAGSETAWVNAISQWRNGTPP